MTTAASSSVPGRARTIDEPECAIYDNFLSEAEFAALAEYAATSDYTLVHSERVRKVWRLHDGLPLQGETTYLAADVTTDRTKSVLHQNAIQLFLARLNRLVDADSHLVGTRETDWQRVSATPWIYPAGTGLSLHADHLYYTGSYTFFLHARWGLHWGGQLLIVNPDRYRSGRATPNSTAYRTPWLAGDTETAAYEDPGVALAIYPKPNRLVLMAPNAHHMITRVDANAGQNARTSIAGFFHVD